jgi:hypothetical protein
MKIVINTCFGGYGLSEKAVGMYIERTNMKLHSYNGIYLSILPDEYQKLVDIENKEKKSHSSNKFCWDYTYIKRTDHILISIIEKLGKEANKEYSDLKVIEIPDNVEYTIEEYDGCEHIAETHRTWK